MKKIITVFALVLALLVSMSAVAAFADDAAQPQEEEKTVDPIVGAWRNPPSPFGDDFACYVVLYEDGSFLYATNLFESGKSSGPYTQTVRTNEDFYWIKLNDTTYELHFDYHDVNGEFVSVLTYRPDVDQLYFGESLYGTRDDSFVLAE